MNEPTVTPEPPSLAEIGAAVDQASAVTGIPIRSVTVSRFRDEPTVQMQDDPEYTVEQGHRLLTALGVPAASITGHLVGHGYQFSVWAGRHGGVVWEAYTVADPAHVEAAEAAAVAAKAAEVQP